LGIPDQKKFTDAVAARRTGWLSEDWTPAVRALNGLAMFDMLPALAAVSFLERTNVEQRANDVVGLKSAKRIMFANIVVRMREIPDWTSSVPDDQINDAREFLGCTRLDDAGVQRTIDDSLATARAAFSTVPPYAGDACCGAIGYAWVKVLVPKRRVPGASLIANLAAAAHYMLARYHVCAVKAKVWQMKVVIDGYDGKKRAAIANGDPNLKSMGLTANRPFPPDFAIRNWAYKGAEEGDRDRLRCNADKSQPFIAPTINQSEWGE
jgi:hypothetical protein